MFVVFFVGYGIWWGLPSLVALLLVALLLVSPGQTLSEDSSSNSLSKHQRQIPARFWVFAGFVLLYGVCETMNGNWASLYLTTHFGANAAVASLGLTMFWTMVTVGRILFAALAQWLPQRLVCRILPFVVMIALLASASAPKTNPLLGVLTFALAGLGCSALLPLALSFGQKELTGIRTSVAGGLIAFYQIGYGLAAFGVGPLQNKAGLHLQNIYNAAGAIAFALAVLSFIVTRKPSSA